MVVPVTFGRSEVIVDSTTPNRNVIMEDLMCYGHVCECTSHKKVIHKLPYSDGQIYNKPSKQPTNMLFKLATV